MRLFVAVPITDEARHDLAHLLDPGEIPGRPTHPTAWHLTLRFIGDVDEVARDRVAASLDQADLGEPFGVRWGELGAFPRPKKATVLWMGLASGADRVDVLHDLVDEALDGAGLPPKDLPFRAHLTLSRIRPPEDVSSLVAGSEALGVSMPVDRIVLYRTHLGAGGARYEELESFPLE